MKSLNKKVIFVTGAGGGFGQQFIKQFLELGAYLVITDINKEVLEKVSTDIVQSIPNCQGKILGVFSSDLSSKKGCEEAYEKAISINTDIEILINNAGLINYGNFHEIPFDKWDTLMQVNLMAPMYLSYYFMKIFAEKKRGHILNISSVSGYIATGHAVPYSTSKFGIRGFGMALHKEGKPLGVAVTNVYPFYSPTPLLNTQTDGKSKTQSVPKLMYDSPEVIVKSAIKGLRKNKLHVYPGVWSKILYFATKFWPIQGNMSK